MYRVVKTLEIAGSHSLCLDYESKCANVHGHNWIVSIHCQSETLNENGMVFDFGHIKGVVSGALDHRHINDVLGSLNPTAENLAKWICDRVPHCVRVDVQESAGNVATYAKDGVA